MSVPKMECTTSSGMEVNIPEEVEENDNTPIFELSAMTDNILSSPYWDKIKLNPLRLQLMIEAKSELIRTKKKIIKMLGA